MPTQHFLCRTQTLRSCALWSTKQTTNRQTCSGWHFYKAQEVLGNCYLFCSPLRILCCSAGVTAIAGCKSRSSLCFGCSAFVFDLVVSQHGGFPNFVGCENTTTDSTKSSLISSLSGGCQQVISHFTAFLLVVHHWSEWQVFNMIIINHQNWDHMKEKYRICLLKTPTYITSKHPKKKTKLN